MSEQEAEVQTEAIEQEGEKQPETDWKALSRKWERVAKAKIDKSEYQKVSDELQKSNERAEKLEADLEAVKAEQSRKDAINAAAAAHRVDAATLERMSGDVEENAKFLADRDKARAPRTRDNGESPKSGGDVMAETAHMLFGRK